jgi:hypothetical protein
MSTTLVHELECEDAPEYRSTFGMDKESFDYLLQLIRPRIEKQDTLLRQCMTPQERLQVTLRYLTTGKLIYALFGYIQADAFAEHATVPFFPRLLSFTTDNAEIRGFI